MLMRARATTGRAIMATWLVRRRTVNYTAFMGHLRTLLLSAVVALLALGMVAHAAGSRAMALDMAMAEGGTMDMAACADCPEGGGSTAHAGCDPACTAAATAVLKGADIAWPMAPSLRRDRPRGRALPRGLRAPPEPFPPKTRI